MKFKKDKNVWYERKVCFIRLKEIDFFLGFVFVLLFSISCNFDLFFLNFIDRISHVSVIIKLVSISQRLFNTNVFYCKFVTTTNT